MNNNQWSIFVVDHSGVHESGIQHKQEKWSAALQELSVRAYKVLQHYQSIESFDELSQFDMPSIRRFRNCGVHTASEIREWAAKHGIIL